MQDFLNVKISYSCIISKQNAAILPTKIQMWQMTMNKLSIKDGLSYHSQGTLIYCKSFIPCNKQNHIQFNMNFK